MRYSPERGPSVVGILLFCLRSIQKPRRSVVCGVARECVGHHRTGHSDTTDHPGSAQRSMLRGQAADERGQYFLKEASLIIGNTF